MPREATIVASIVRVAKEHGWWVMKIHGGPYQLAGVPDLLCLKEGRAVFLEVKQPGNKPTAIQCHRMNEIETEGGAVCHVVTSKEEASACLRTDAKDSRGVDDDSVVDRRRRTGVRGMRRKGR
jgi:hypothetical protein